MRVKKTRKSKDQRNEFQADSRLTYLSSDSMRKVTIRPPAVMLTMRNLRIPSPEISHHDCSSSYLCVFSRYPQMCLFSFVFLEWSLLVFFVVEFERLLRYLHRGSRKMCLSTILFSNVNELSVLFRVVKRSISLEPIRSITLFPVGCSLTSFIW